jgi:TolB-like protein
MTGTADFWRHLKQRKLVQWALAYVAFAFALLQGADIVAQQFGWPHGLQRGITLALVLGFFVTLVLAWYHGERGAQKVSGAELLVLALLLAVGGGLLWRFTGVPSMPGSEPVDPAAPASAPGTKAPPAKSIAVLPFENLSADKDNEYFVAGMQDLILTKLADIDELKVISRTSTMKYRSRPENLRQIGSELGVAHVLEGSVQRQGDAVLINVQLVDTATDAHLWAESYQRTLDNVFGVEGEVAGKVADALKARLSPTDADRLATSLGNDPAADDLYLRAEYFTGRGDTDFDTAQYKQAIPLYRQALDRAPAFSLALARLSYVESVLAWFGGGGEDVGRLQADARGHAEEVLARAPGLPEAQLAMGFSNYYGKGDYASALRNFRAALKLRPNDDKALTAQGYVLRRQGRFDAALASLSQAQVRDPRNSALALTQGETLMMLFRYPQAEAALQRALALDPANVQARYRLSCVILLSRGDIPAALAAARGEAPRLKLWRVTLLTLQRNYRQALDLLDSLPDTPDNFRQSDFGEKTLMQADLRRMLGEAAQARALYARAISLERGRLDAADGIDIRAAEIQGFVARAELGLGHDDRALAALGRTIAHVEQAHDFADGPSRLVSIAATYARARRADLAVPVLDGALAMPGVGVNYSPVLLWIDPAWDPVRADPGFQALLAKHAGHKPDDRFIVPAPAATVAAGH